MVGRFPPGGHPAQTPAETQGPHRAAETHQLSQPPAACAGGEDRSERSVSPRQRQEIQEVLRQELRSRVLEAQRRVSLSRSSRVVGRGESRRPAAVKSGSAACNALAISDSKRYSDNPSSLSVNATLQIVDMARP